MSRYHRDGSARRTRLSLPSIRVSAPNSAEASPHSSIKAGSKLSVHDFANGPESSASAAISRTGTPRLAALSLATSQNSQHEDTQRPKTAKEFFLNGARESGKKEELAQSQSQELEPLLPVDLLSAIQTSMTNCAEYERKIASLQHDIEHNILLWQDILGRYESQDRTATDLRDNISSSLSSLSMARSTIEAARTDALDKDTTLDKLEGTIKRLQEKMENSKEVLHRIEDRIEQEEIQVMKVDKVTRVTLLVISTAVSVPVVAYLGYIGWRITMWIWRHYML